MGSSSESRVRAHLALSLEGRSSGTPRTHLLRKVFVGADKMIPQ